MQTHMQLATTCCYNAAVMTCAEVPGLTLVCSSNQRRRIPQFGLQHDAARVIVVHRPGSGCGQQDLENQSLTTCLTA